MMIQKVFSTSAGLRHHPAAAEIKGTLPHHEHRIEVADRMTGPAVAADALQQHFDGVFGDLSDRIGDTAQRRKHLHRHRQVVESDDRQLLRHFQFADPGAAQHPHRQQVVVTEQPRLAAVVKFDELGRRQHLVEIAGVDQDDVFRGQSPILRQQLAGEALEPQIVLKIFNPDINEIPAAAFDQMPGHQPAGFEVVHHDHVAVEILQLPADDDERKRQFSQRRNRFFIMGRTDQESFGAAVGQHRQLGLLMLKVVIAAGRKDFDITTPAAQLDRIDQPGKKRVVDVRHQHRKAPAAVELGRLLPVNDLQPFTGALEDAERLQLRHHLLGGHQRDAELFGDFPNRHKRRSDVAVLAAGDLPAQLGNNLLFLVITVGQLHFRLLVLFSIIVTI